MKYLDSKPFSVGGHDPKYSEGWDRIFGKRIGQTHEIDLNAGQHGVCKLCGADISYCEVEPECSGEARE